MIIDFGNPKRRRGSFSFGGNCDTALGMLVGITPGRTDASTEVQKARLGMRYGVSTITDLTTNGQLDLLNQLLELDLTVGTVPIYYANLEGKGSLASRLLKHVERCVESGVDFFSIHASLTKPIAEAISSTNRVIPITSRGGAMIFERMYRDRCDNPYLTIFDDLLQICRAHSVALSFVASLRPGSIVDWNSSEYKNELLVIAELVNRASEAGVATIVELLNHLPLNAISSHLDFGRTIYPHSALGALGPTPTDIAVGLDDVAGAIGAALACVAGIDWINLVTAGEHSHLPSIEETIQALRYFQLALHIAGLTRNHGVEKDRSLSVARAANDWDAMARCASDPDFARQIFSQHTHTRGNACSMCGGTCPLVKARHMSTDRRATPSIAGGVIDAHAT